MERRATLLTHRLPSKKASIAWLVMVICTIGAALLALVALPQHSARGATTTSPIQHVVVIDMENHSFDNVLGQLCIIDKRPGCDAASQGKVSSGKTVQLSRATDLVPNVVHDEASQTSAIDGGKMDGFNKISGCGSSGGYACYTQFYPDQIPNTAALARRFAISDHTFEQHSVPSWGGILSSRPRSSMDSGVTTLRRPQGLRLVPVGDATPTRSPSGDLPPHNPGSTNLRAYPNRTAAALSALHQ
jgi:phospholipase C